MWSLKEWEFWALTWINDAKPRVSNANHALQAVPSPRLILLILHFLSQQYLENYFAHKPPSRYLNSSVGVLKPPECSAFELVSSGKPLSHLPCFFTFWSNSTFSMF